MKPTGTTTKGRHDAWIWLKGFLTEGRLRGDQVRVSPPVGRAFGLFIAGAAALVVLTVVEAGRWSAIGANSLPAAYLGVAATTVFTLSGLVGVYRSVTTGENLAGIFGVVFWGPAAVWSAMVFIASSADGRIAAEGRMMADLAIPVAAVVAYVLLGRGFRKARWVEVFTGLAASLIVLISAVVSARPSFSASSNGLVLLAILAATSGLYGLLVDIEVSDFKSRDQLYESNKRLVGVIRGTEDLLHDLRSGLLSIEAAARVSGDRLGPSISSEAARLRRMTMGEEGAKGEFDLVAGIKALIETKQASGSVVSFAAPDQVRVYGSESDLLAIVDNLLSNAVRHGRPPVEVAIVEEVDGDERVTEVSIINGGVGFTPSLGAKWFKRGFTTDPNSTGIGLDRVRNLAERNEAEIVVDAEGGEKTRSALVLRQSQSSESSDLSESSDCV